MPQNLTLSIIIPAYNEEKNIYNCLDAISNQTSKPDEVILVDNNCLDRTVEIAKKFSFVKIVKETKQGMIHARNKGYSVANGDILGRIDCDAKISTNWVAETKKSFKELDIDAVTGIATTKALPFIDDLRTTFYAKAYHLAARHYFKLPVLWGSNMAMSRKAWNTIESKVSFDQGIVHEDQDLSILLWATGAKIKYNKNIIISTEGDQFVFLPKLLEYAHRTYKTKRYHRHAGTLLDAQDNARLNKFNSLLILFFLSPLSLLMLILGIVVTSSFVLKKTVYILVSKLFCIHNYYRFRCKACS